MGRLGFWPALCRKSYFDKSLPAGGSPMVRPRSALMRWMVKESATFQGYRSVYTNSLPAVARLLLQLLLASRCDADYPGDGRWRDESAVELQ